MTGTVISIVYLASVREEGGGHSMQKGQRQKRCGNQHCGKSRKTIRNGEGAKLKTATGIRGSSVSDSNTKRGSNVSDTVIVIHFMI